MSRYLRDLLSIQLFSAYFHLGSINGCFVK